MQYQEHVEPFLTFLREEEGARPSTLKNYRHELDRLARARVPLEREAVLKWIGEGARGPVAPATRNWRLMTVRRFLRFLVKHGVLASDPTADIDRVAVPRKRRAPVSLSGLRRGLRLLARKGGQERATGRSSRCSSRPGSGFPKCTTSSSTRSTSATAS